MVFMGVDAVGDDAPLDTAADADIAEMEAAWSTSGFLNIFVQKHEKGVASRRQIGVGQWHDVPPEQSQLQGGRALANFVSTSLRAVDHQATDHSMLVLWGHAYDFAVGPSITGSGNVDALEFVELSAVLRDLQNEMWLKYPGEEPPRLNIVAFDACDASTVELACQLSPFAKYLLASQIGVPIPGWPYDQHPRTLWRPYRRTDGTRAGRGLHRAEVPRVVHVAATGVAVPAGSRSRAGALCPDRGPGHGARPVDSSEWRHARSGSRSVRAGSDRPQQALCGCGRLLSQPVPREH